MYEIELGQPDGGPEALFGGALSLAGLDPSPEEIAAVLDAVGEVSEDEWRDAQRAADAIAGLSDEELASLEADGALYGGQDLLGGGEFNAWLDGKSDQQFAALTEAASASGDYENYLHFVHQIDANLASDARREQQRRAEDAESAAAGRLSAEVRLANGLDRVSRGTYTYGGTPAVELAGDPDLFAAGPAASRMDTLEEMCYQLGTRKSLPSARQRTQPLPPVQDLARAIGLR